MSDGLDRSVETDRFDLEDLLFSRTDERGVISSVNAVFCRVTAMDAEKLLGAPHNIVRNPAMPRAVFRVLWTRLQEGKPVGAYVQNQASDGTSYWVFAVLVPSGEGIISVRMKPSSKRLGQVKALYAELRALEDKSTDAKDVMIDASVDKFMGSLAQFEAEDYAHFMAESLSLEMSERAVSLGRAKLYSLNALTEIEEAAHLINEDAATVAKLFERTKQIPYNMRLQAGRLEGSDGPISVVSSNHRIMTQNLAKQVQLFREAAELGTGPVRETMFVLAATILMTEVVQQLSREQSSDDLRRHQDKIQMNALNISFVRQARKSISEMAKHARQFSRMCKDLRRALSGLELTRIMCEIEQSKIPGDTAGLDEITQQLLTAEQDLSTAMSRIEQAVAGVLENAETLVNSVQTAA